MLFVAFSLFVWLLMRFEAGSLDYIGLILVADLVGLLRMLRVDWQWACCHQYLFAQFVGL